MLKFNPFIVLRRLRHHDSTFSNKRYPDVKIANPLVTKQIEKRLDAYAQPKINHVDPVRKFEPFPFKVTEENKVESLRNIISPLCNTPYEDQLTLKESHCKRGLRLLTQQLYRTGTPIRQNISRLPCHVKPIVRSPKLTDYRSKDEFSIWTGLDGKTLTVGYMVFPISRHGDTVCVEPEGVETMKNETIEMGKLLQEFIRTKRRLPICRELGYEGGWRRFMTKVNSLGQLMLVGVVSPTETRVKDIMEEKEIFRDFMVNRSMDVGLDLKSLYFQACPNNKCLHKHAPYELLYGEKTLRDTTNNYAFAISPESYIPVNLYGLDMFYKTIRETIQECFHFDTKPLIIDAQCGIGLLAINLSDMATQVVGIDNRSQAIEDARFNSELNKIINSEFICAELEIIIERLLEKYSRSKHEILVVFNPSKSGLKKNVAQALRRCEAINKIVYITPKVEHQNVQNDLMELCQKDTEGRPTKPFVPVLAAPIDMYPHVEAVDLIIALERFVK